MLVHFIGGPRDGKREVFSSVPAVLQFPVSEPISYRTNPAATVGFSVAEYRVTGRSRYAIAEYVEPAVKTMWSVGIEVDPYSTPDMSALSEWLRGRRVDFPGDRNRVVFVEAQTYSSGKTTIGLQVIVDGPPTPAALADAGEQIQRWLDSNVPVGVKVTACTGSVTD